MLISFVIFCHSASLTFNFGFMSPPKKKEKKAFMQDLRIKLNFENA